MLHDLLHFDLPWNPSRLEQRNGRIDRKLQPPPKVFCRYFGYRQRPEDRVLQALVRKTETIREELGSAGQVIAERHRSAAHPRRHCARRRRSAGAGESRSSSEDTRASLARREMDG